MVKDILQTIKVVRHRAIKVDPEAINHQQNFRIWVLDSKICTIFRITKFHLLKIDNFDTQDQEAIVPAIVGTITVNTLHCNIAHLHKNQITNTTKMSFSKIILNLTQ